LPLLDRVRYTLILVYAFGTLRMLSVPTAKPRPPSLARREFTALCEDNRCKYHASPSA
jgi:hypothetical protein